MGKKKPFVDRKTAAVYHVVRRSQRDVGTEATASELSEYVLMPSPDNARRAEAKADAKADARAEAGGRAAGDAAAGASAKPATYGAPSKTTSFDALKSHLASAGMLDAQSATYAKYTKPIHPGGKFISSTDAAHIPTEDAANLDALFTDTSKNELDEALREAMEVNEVGRMLDSIALNADCMEDDVAKALFDFEEGEYEEILDDFCLTADQEQLEEETGEGNDGGTSDEFDYEKHIQALMAKARAQDAGELYEAGRELEGDFFAGRTPLHGKIDEEGSADDFDYDRYGEEEEDSLDREFNGQQTNSGGSRAAVANVGDEQQRILCQKFEEALLEYDSDDVGDLDEECEEIVGDRPLEGDAQLEAALNEFLTEKEDEVLFEGTHKKEGRTKRAGGSGYAALVGKTMVNAGELDESKALLVNIEESKNQMQKDLAEADAILANPEMDLPPEEVFIDGKSYFSQTSRNPWDCESILSTYSNLDNNPAVIGRTKKKKKGKKTRVADIGGTSDAIPEEGPAKIRLSNKTGLPLGAFDHPSPEEEYDEYYEDDTQVSVNLGVARDKNESKLEKKQRKMAIKEERKICRMQKKILKEAFGEEFQRRGRAEVADAVGGSSVFRFS